MDVADPGFKKDREIIFGRGVGLFGLRPIEAYALEGRGTKGFEFLIVTSVL